ncbi:CHAT domain-containing protein [Streptomyces sp. NPDC059340]|uniref:CHAT domain-containing protein n=1 Tax=Streptomyces sp. NPDC059340 TaxID=3346806 RepID=UPI0036939A31
MRESMLRKVVARVRAAEAGAGADHVLSGEALTEAVRLLAHRQGPGIDLDALTACGLLFFHRSRVQHPERRIVEVVAAGQLLGPVHVHRPSVVPALVRSLYEGGIDPWEYFSTETGFTTDPEVWWALHLEPAARHLESGDLAELELCVGLLRLAGTSAAPDHPALVRVLARLGVQLGMLRAATHDPDTCAETVEVCGSALDRMPSDAPLRSLVLGQRGMAALDLAKQLDDVAAARLAVDCFRAGRQLDDSEPMHELNLGGALVELARLTEDDAPRYEALRVFRCAADKPGGAKALHNLLAVLTLLLSLPGQEEALTAFCRSSLAGPGPEGPNDVPALRVLFLIALQSAEGHERELDILSEAVALGRRILAVARDDEALGEAANNVCAALWRIAQATHDVATAREAVTLGRSAVKYTARTETLHPSVALGNLAIAHNVVFELTGDPESQREAVHQSRLAVADLDPADGSMHSDLVSSHGMILHRYASRLNDQALLREALGFQRRACALPDLRPGQLVRRLSALTALLSDLYSLSPREPLTTVREAVEHGERALALVPPGDASLSFVLNELARARRLLADAENDSEGLDTAIGLADRVLAAGPSVARVTLMSAELERAMALRKQAALSGDPGLLDTALAGFGRVADSPEASPQVRMKAAFARADATRTEGTSAMERLAQAVEILRLNIASGPLWNDRETTLRSFSGLTEKIISTGLAADDPVSIVELLEQSRGLLSEDAMDIRGELRGLEPALADELRVIAVELGRLDARDRAAPNALEGRRELDREIAAERAELTRRWTRLRAAAPRPGAPDPVALAAEGPIVMVAALSAGGHALLLTGDPSRPVRVLGLPDLTSGAAGERVLTFLTARHYATAEVYPLRVRRIAQAEVRDTLAWLWRTAAEPVLAALGLMSTPEKHWPRMWWCPIGFLNYLPWHAAGDDAGAGVLDRVVSSYTASLRALDYARRTPPGTATDRTLIVAQPEAPSSSVLRGVSAEVRMIRHLLPDATVVSGPDATKATVLEALAGHANVHLACHAMTDVHSPGTSRLLLADHETQPLTVADLAALHLPGRQLAMLSACSTSEVSADLTDEALHLTGAFQLAGFRHVIGALWPVSDGTAGDVTRSFYEHLTGGGSHAPRADGAAHALHTAVRRLRDANAAVPTVWASYIHTGA